MIIEIQYASSRRFRSFSTDKIEELLGLPVSERHQFLMNNSQECEDIKDTYGPNVWYPDDGITAPNEYWGDQSVLDEWKGL